MDSHGAPIGPLLPPREIEQAAQRQVRNGAPYAQRNEADDQHEMLHHRVHDRQNRDRGERRYETLYWMLSDAVHAPA